LNIFYQANQQQMADVAKLMQTQVNIDHIIQNKKENKPLDLELVTNIKAQYEELKSATGIGIINGNRDNNINWLKTDASPKAFKGTLEEYIKTRSKQLGMNTREANDLANAVNATNQSQRQNFDDIIRSSNLDTRKLSDYINKESPSVISTSVSTNSISSQDWKQDVQNIRDSINHSKESSNDTPDIPRTRKRGNAVKLPSKNQGMIV
jgi:hypothetical protein